MSKEFKILFLGDMVGRPGRTIVKHFLSEILASDDAPDFVIANVENASHGFGLTEKNHNELAAAGINCFTSGNHIWDRKDIFEYIDKSARLVRPANYPEGTKGVGHRIFEVNGTKIAVINLLGRTFMNAMDSPWDYVKNVVPELKKEAQIVVVDFHAEATAEKICFGKYCASLGVSAVLGTHTHVQTSDEKIFDNYTAYITDAGFCGVYDSIIGMAYENSLKRLVTSLPERFEIAEGSVLELNAVMMAFDPVFGGAKSIERIRYIKDFSEVS